MKLSLKQEFATTPEDMIVRYASREFFEKKYAALGAQNIQVLDMQHTADQFSIQVRFDIKSDAPMPDMAKKLIGETSTVTQRDSWNLKAKTGRIDCEIKGLPGKVSAEMKLLAGGKGVINQLDWEIKCSIPLIGGKIEGMVAEDIKAKSARDAVVTAQVLGL